MCVSGYEGVFCHINIDECASQPCLNNGKCVDKINSFHCECQKGEKKGRNAKHRGVNGVKVRGYWTPPFVPICRVSGITISYFS